MGLTKSSNVETKKQRDLMTKAILYRKKLTKETRVDWVIHRRRSFLKIGLVSILAHSKHVFMWKRQYNIVHYETWYSLTKSKSNQFDTFFVRGDAFYTNKGNEQIYSNVQHWRGKTNKQKKTKKPNNTIISHLFFWGLAVKYIHINNMQLP